MVNSGKYVFYIIFSLKWVSYDIDKCTYFALLSFTEIAITDSLDMLYLFNLNHSKLWRSSWYQSVVLQSTRNSWVFKTNSSSKKNCIALSFFYYL
jgi:CTP:phosphocholine cytidylyltransferase-like protein